MNSQKDILIETTMSALQGELKRKKLIDILSNKDKRNLLLEILNTKNKQQIADLFLKEHVLLNYVQFVHMIKVILSD